MDEAGDGGLRAIGEGISSPFLAVELDDSDERLGYKIIFAPVLKYIIRLPQQSAT